AGVPGVDSLTATLVRLRFSVALAPFAAVSLGVAGAGGAASSRARALVDRRGSVMVGGGDGRRHGSRASSVTWPQRALDQIPRSRTTLVRCFGVVNTSTACGLEGEKCVQEAGSDRAARAGSNLTAPSVSSSRTPQCWACAQEA
ncbi:hypothetical protein SVAN01_09250, partial [Stagonosporopsis vannaccii]